MTPYIIRKKKRNSKKKLLKRIVGAILISFGTLLFFYFFFPVIFYQFFFAFSLEQANIEFPIPRDLVITRDGTIGDVISQRLVSLSKDFTDARNWYPKIRTDKNTIAINSYTITIPKLRIENAEVATKDYDLSRHLVQYFGTSIPGENGTAVIFGHSTLPQLFSAKNYKSIFATLHKLKTGDIFFTNVNGVTRKYKIFAITITNPEDTKILSQTFDRSYITLVTCTPPGTIWKRLVVRAAIDSI